MSNFFYTDHASTEEVKAAIERAMASPQVQAAWHDYNQPSHSMGDVVTRQQRLNAALRAAGLPSNMQVERDSHGQLFLKDDGGVNWGNIGVLATAGVMTAGVASAALGGGTAAATGGATSTAIPGTASTLPSVSTIGASTLPAGGAGIASGVGGTAAAAGGTAAAKFAADGTPIFTGGVTAGGIGAGKALALGTLAGAGTGALAGGTPGSGPKTTDPQAQDQKKHAMRNMLLRLAAAGGASGIAAIGKGGDDPTDPKKGGGMGGGNYPPELQELLAMSLRRMNSQEGLFNAVNAQALGGLPRQS